MASFSDWHLSSYSKLDISAEAGAAEVRPTSPQCVGSSIDEALTTMWAVSLSPGSHGWAKSQFKNARAACDSEPRDPPKFIQ